MSATSGSEDGLEAARQPELQVRKDFGIQNPEKRKGGTHSRTGSKI